jgi:histone demethylase JARID1
MFAPTFYPSQDEFGDPIAYINQIKQKASKYGICKIIPPVNWKPKFNAKRNVSHLTQELVFRTRKQQLNMLEGTSRELNNFISALYKFHLSTGAEVPQFGPTKIASLRRIVNKSGGYDHVILLKTGYRESIVEYYCKEL